MVNGFYKVEIFTNIWQMRFEYLLSVNPKTAQTVTPTSNISMPLSKEGLRLFIPVPIGMSRVVLKGVVEVPGR